MFKYGFKTGLELEDAVLKHLDVLDLVTMFPKEPSLAGRQKDAETGVGYEFCQQEHNSCQSYFHRGHVPSAIFAGPTHLAMSRCFFTFNVFPLLSYSKRASALGCMMDPRDQGQHEAIAGLGNLGMKMED